MFDSKTELEDFIEQLDVETFLITIPFGGTQTDVTLIKTKDDEGKLTHFTLNFDGDGIWFSGEKEIMEYAEFVDKMWNGISCFQCKLWNELMGDIMEYQEVTWERLYSEFIEENNSPFVKIAQF